MKKLFTILCAVMLTFSLTAQTETGNMIVGATSNLGYTSTTPDGGDAISAMHLGGTFGYFVIDNLAVMGGLGYTKTGDADATTSFGVGARYYMNGMFGGVMYNIPGEKLSEIAIGVGYVHMLTDNISLEPALEYSMLSSDGNAMSSTFGLNVGFGLYF